MLFVIALSLAACLSPAQRVAETLDDVETYINERPDSALAVLEGVDSTALSTRALRARYSLLHTMTLDKCYEDITAPGLLDDAIRYYDRHGNPDEKLKTLYYKGCILQEQKDLNAAAIAYSQAEEYASQATDAHAVALLYEGIASVYNVVHNTAKEQEYAEKTLAKMRESGDPMCGSALGNLAMVYHTKREWALADSLYREAIAHFDAYPYALTIYLSNYARMKLLSPEKDPAGALDLLNRIKGITGGVLTPKEGGAYAYASELLGDREAADAFVEKLQAIPEPSRNDVVSWLYRIALAREDSLQALSYLREMRRWEYDEVVETLTDSVTQTLQDHYSQKAQQERERKLRQGIWGLSAIALLLLLAIVLLLRERRLRLERDRLISIRASLEQDLREQENRAEAYSSDLSSRVDHLRKQLQQERLDRLRKSGHYGYWLWLEQNSRSSDQEIVRSLRMDLKDICTLERDHRALERRLDSELDGLVSRLKEDLGLNGKQEEERFLCFWLIGLKADMISELMGITANNVYVRKYRLEDRIRRLNNPEYQSLIKEKSVKPEGI